MERRRQTFCNSLRSFSCDCSLHAQRQCARSGQGASEPRFDAGVRKASGPSARLIRSPVLTQSDPKHVRLSQAGPASATAFSASHEQRRANVYCDTCSRPRRSGCFRRPVSRPRAALQQQRRKRIGTDCRLKHHSCLFRRAVLARIYMTKEEIV